MIGRRVIDAIDDALVIRERHPALFIRVANAGGNCLTLSRAYDCYLAGISTDWWFTADRGWGEKRAQRRAKGKRQRQARKANR